MDNVVLTPVPLEELLTHFRQIVREENNSRQSAEIADKLYSPEQACRVFNPAISKVTLAKWSKQGSIPSRKIGGRVFYKYSDLIKPE